MRHLTPIDLGLLGRTIRRRIGLAIGLTVGCTGAARPTSPPPAPAPVAAPEAPAAPLTTDIPLPSDPPLPSGPLDGIIRISAGTAQTCALRRDGSVVCWGENGVGQAGARLAKATSTRPHLVHGLTGIVDVAAGSFHTCALDRDAHAWCWGSLGLGVTESTVTSILPRNDDTSVAGIPVRLRDRSGAIDGVRSLGLAIGDQNACAVVSGEVLCWTTEDMAPEGLLLRPRRISWPGVTKVAVSADNVCALVSAAPGGHARIECARGSDAPTPVAWPASMHDPVDVSFGTQHLCALDARGAVLCWWRGVDARWWKKPGRAIEGLPGGAVAIAVGSEFACAIARDGSVGCFLAEGAAFNDDMARSAWASRDTRARPIRGVDHAVAITAGMGRDVFGHGYACAIRADSSVVCWGDGESGQLGDGRDRAATTAVGVIVP